MLSGVSKTAILTLRARADEHARADALFSDPHAVRWLELAGWPEELDRWYSPNVQSFLAFRADQLDRLVGRFVASTPRALVVELGAGLSSRALRIGPAAEGGWVDLDLPEVIALRESLGIGGAGHRHLACSVLDRAWLDALEVEDPARVFFVAEGLLYYLDRAEVDALFLDLRRRFPCATIAFDVLGRVDWDATLARSTAVGTPVRWMVDPPFERVWPDLGLAVIPGLEPEALMHEVIERYFVRFGADTQRTMRLLARMPSIAGDRSGTVIGTLAPL